MMVLVGLIDLFVEYVKVLIGQRGNIAARVLAWVVLLSVIAAVIGLIAWGVSMIPELIDLLNG